jgi:hypothetical protein
VRKKTEGAMPDTTSQGNLFDEIFEEPLLQAQGDDGIGPTLGMDLSGKDDCEQRSFAPCDEKVMRGARSA